MNSRFRWAICRTYPKALLPTVACLWLLASLMAWSSAHAGSDRNDHDRARQAVAAGLVLPLPVVLERLQKNMPGQVLEVELEREREAWIYEIKLLTPAGQLSKVKVDARTGAPMEPRRRDDRPLRRAEDNAARP